MLALGFILMQGGVGRLKVFVAKLIYVSWDAKGVSLYAGFVMPSGGLMRPALVCYT